MLEENDSVKARYGLVVTVMLLLAILASSTVVQAAAPYTSIGSAFVDGNAGEWTLIADFFADMTRAGKVDARHPVESKAYLRYDITNQVMYVLVLTEPGILAKVSPGDAWAAINSIHHKVFTGYSINNAYQPNFAWVDRGFDGNNNHAKGFEASFRIAPGEYQIIIHLKVIDEGECETSATAGLKAGIDLFVVPEYPWAGLTALLSCFGALVFFKKRSLPRIRSK
jgi:hypothetical protein